METLASQISAAVTLCSLYPANHPRLLHGVDQVLQALQNVIRTQGGDSATFLLIGDDLVVGDDNVIRKTTQTVQEFIDLMKRNGIERLTLAAAVGRDEAQRFITSLHAVQPQASPNIRLGRATVVMDDDTDRDRPKELSLQQLEVVRDAWAKFRVNRNLPIDQLEELVWSFIDSLGKTTRAMLPLANLREHDEYTYIHSINVSLMVLAQAKSFGIWGPTLHSFGMAALLHDIGKLTIPVSILNKAGMLDDDEWEAMKGHAEEGAWYLAAIEGTPPLAIIVAFEHHLRHDGRENYPALRARRMPHLASKMTAIADAFDAVSASRPHQKPLGRAAAFEVLRKRSSTFYDPILIDNFVKLFGDLGSGL
jgi:HD-GYP domain-containing protein (c-di-GMP phosphodiesterase class II)